MKIECFFFFPFPHMHKDSCATTPAPNGGGLWHSIFPQLYLDQLGRREQATWNQIAAHIPKRQPNEYDKAVTLLIDLRDLALRQGRWLHSNPPWGSSVRSTPPRKVFCAG